MNANLRKALISILLSFALTVVACGSGDDGGDNSNGLFGVGGESFVMEEAAEMSEPAMDIEIGDMDDAGADFAGEAEAPQPQAFGTQPPQGNGGEGLFNTSAASDRMIIKNADMNLLVAQTDVAIDRLTQIVGDFGGYIISSREWYTDWYGENFKNATYTFAVPVDQFERSLIRLREISVRVLDERSSGEDVTQEFVDLDSQLRNLEATRDRIRTFLDQAKTVEEALNVNEELSKIDAEIEKAKGRMNYLTGRAAFSTITVTLTPELPEFEPTATATPTATMTPTATPTTTPWAPGETFTDASKKLGSAYRNMTEMFIWILVYVVPIFAPFVLVLWFFIAQANKRTRARKVAEVKKVAKKTK